MCETCGCNGEAHIHHHAHELPGNTVNIERHILEQNQRFALNNRNYFSEQNIFTINLVSSPGSGKTTLLLKTIAQLKSKYDLAVIEGDQQTEYDKQLIAEHNIPVIQINTGKGCHLDAHGISHAIGDLALKSNSLLFIENVGNLVCPALFDLGEHHKVVILSVTEGDNKPLKYPFMFEACNLMIINKIDLLPYVDFDINTCTRHAKHINPMIEVMAASATKGEGLGSWYHWLEQEIK